MINQKTQVTDKPKGKASKKKKKYQIHKRESVTLAETYDEINPDKADRLRNCAVELFKETYPDGSERFRTFHCGVRMCSVCSWRRSEKAGAQTFQIADQLLKDFPDYRFIMTTFTQRNCLPEELNEELTKITAAFHKMARTKAFKAAVKGFARSVEITHNLATDMFHPHVHVIFVVHRNYFTGETYLNQGDWIQMWRKAMRLEYDPNVDVRKVKGSLVKAVAEVTKYAVKSNDYIVPDQWEFTVRTVRLLDAVLHKRRFFAFGGIMKDYHKKLNLSDPDIPDEDEPERVEPVVVECYQWFDSIRQYRKVEYL